MSLRSRPRDTVLVQLFEPVTGSMGQDEYRKSGEPLAVACNVYPLTATESETDGLVNSQLRTVKLHQGVWPADQHSELTFDGGLWEQVGPPVRYNKGAQTRHVSVTIRWIGKAPS